MWDSIINHVVTIFSVFLAFWLGANYAEKIRKKEKNEAIVENFYNPLCSLLKENNQLYEDFSQKTFDNDNFNKRDEAGCLWESLKEKAIIPNLHSIRNLLLQYKNFYENTQMNQTYFDLQLHCLAFTIYNESPNELHKKYKFCKEWIEQIEKERNDYIRRNK